MGEDLPRKYVNWWVRGMGGALRNIRLVIESGDTLSHDDLADLAYLERYILALCRYAVTREPDFPSPHAPYLPK